MFFFCSVLLFLLNFYNVKTTVIPRGDDPQSIMGHTPHYLKTGWNHHLPLHTVGSITLGLGLLKMDDAITNSMVFYLPALHHVQYIHSLMRYVVSLARVLRSDQDTNLVGAPNELTEALKEMNRETCEISC